MRKIYALAVIITLFGAISYGFESRNNGVDTTQQVTDATDQYVYRKLANGAIVHEPAPKVGLEQIEPAAGGTDSSEPSFKYDPLTQTYRRVTVDSHGNSSQDIIRDPRNP